VQPYDIKLPEIFIWGKIQQRLLGLPNLNVILSVRKYATIYFYIE